MLYGLVVDTKRDEREEMERLIHREAAYLSEDMWNLQVPVRTAQLPQLLEQEFDLVCIDVTAKGMLSWTEQFRKSHGGTLLLIIADASIPPTAYLKPSIMPGGLLLRPVKTEQMQKTLRDLMQLCIDRLNKQDGAGHFVVEERGERTIVEYGSIYYFESREKKIFVRCAAREYGFYDTLDHLAEVLPGYFIRCHRSYIINRRKVEKVLLGQNCIELEHGMTIPVSRSYRAEVKNL
ncbi:MAG: LytTR family transcriptional regulator [Lachnospiraceae bacterium]|nr:LytTR family transcriptional regulator [Lachnospiraceae bacterium]